MQIIIITFKIIIIILYIIKWNCIGSNNNIIIMKWNEQKSR